MWTDRDGRARPVEWIRIPELAAVCHFTTRKLAGRSAAREVVELILKAQGRWEKSVPWALA
jgi:3-deoxy-D-manno-octulosonate 8-phosphate phosphatase (KDO 8-P phosphatase)